MSEKGFVHFAVATYALDEALEAQRKEREEEEREEQKKRMKAEEDPLENESVPHPKRMRSVPRKPDSRLVVDPALNALLTKHR